MAELQCEAPEMLFCGKVRMRMRGNHSPKVDTDTSWSVSPLCRHGGRNRAWRERRGKDRLETRCWGKHPVGEAALRDLGAIKASSTNVASPRGQCLLVSLRDKWLRVLPTRVCSIHLHVRHV